VPGQKRRARRLFAGETSSGICHEPCRSLQLSGATGLGHRLAFLISSFLACRFIRAMSSLITAVLAYSVTDISFHHLSSSTSMPPDMVRSAISRQPRSQNEAARAELSLSARMSQANSRHLQTPATSPIPANCLRRLGPCGVTPITLDRRPRISTEGGI
jgi:hypothetical protein